MPDFIAPDPIEKEKTRSFDGYKGAKSARLKTLVQQITHELEALENRKRKRKAKDQETFEVAIEAIVCNLLHSQLTNPDRRISVPLSNRHLSTKSRYRSPVLGAKFPDHLKLLASEAMGLVDLKIGHKKVVALDNDGRPIFDTKVSSIKATPKLLQRAGADFLEFSDFGRLPGEEVIILKAEKEWHSDNGQWIQYKDTPETIRMKSELEEINAWLGDIDLYVQTGNWVPDCSRKRLLRIFNNSSFGEGGRLYHGLWQDLNKATRRNELLINGQSVVELDYGQMFLRMLYADTATGAPDVEDLYAIPDCSYSRDGLKKITTAALTTDSVLTRMPEGARKHFPDDLPFSEVMAKITEYHAPIAPHLFTGVGMKLQKREADIMVKLLLKAKAQNLILLPIHDGVLCQAGRELETKQLMETVFREETGANAVVRIEHR